jgi:hypothetical protein
MLLTADRPTTSRWAPLSGANAPIRSGRSSKARTEADTSCGRHPRRGVRSLSSQTSVQPSSLTRALARADSLNSTPGSLSAVRGRVETRALRRRWTRPGLALPWSRHACAVAQRERDCGGGEARPWRRTMGAHRYHPDSAGPRAGPPLGDVRLAAGAHGSGAGCLGTDEVERAAVSASPRVVEKGLGPGRYGSWTTGWCADRRWPGSSAVVGRGPHR